MSLSDLPGISDANDTPLAPLPGRFISFNAHCEIKQVLLTWKTAQERNSNHFDIERSFDAIKWTVIGNLPASGNSRIGRSYFTDNNTVQNSYYRIAEYDLDGRVEYTNFRSSFSTNDVFNVWPNPVHDKVFANITTTNASQAIMKLFDKKGALVKVQQATVLQGNNQLSVDMESLAKGVYSLSVVWDNEQLKKQCSC